MFMSDVHVWAHLVQSCLLIQINLCKGKWKTSFSGHLVPFTAFPKLFPFFVIKYVSSLSETINIIVLRNIYVNLCNTIWKAQRCPYKKVEILFLIEKKKSKAFVTPKATHECPQKNVSPFGLAVWPAIRNIYIYECLVIIYKKTLIYVIITLIYVISKVNLCNNNVNLCNLLTLTYVIINVNLCKINIDLCNHTVNICNNKVNLCNNNVNLCNINVNLCNINVNLCNINVNLCSINVNLCKNNVNLHNISVK